MPRIPRHPHGHKAHRTPRSQAVSPGLSWQARWALVLLGAGALLWLGQFGHQLGSS